MSSSHQGAVFFFLLGFFLLHAHSSFLVVSVVNFEQSVSITFKWRTKVFQLINAKPKAKQEV